MRFNEQLSKHMVRGPQRGGAQRSRIGCIGLRPALVVRKGVGTPFPRIPTPLHPWKIPTARPRVQVTMKAASQHFSPRASFKPIWTILSKNVPHL